MWTLIVSAASKGKAAMRSRAPFVATLLRDGEFSALAPLDTLYVGDGDLTIGAFPAPRTYTQLLTAQVAEVAVWKEALSFTAVADEFRRHAAAGRAGDGDGDVTAAGNGNAAATGATPTPTPTSMATATTTVATAAMAAAAATEAPVPQPQPSSPPLPQPLVQWLFDEQQGVLATDSSGHRIRPLNAGSCPHITSHHITSHHITLASVNHVLPCLCYQILTFFSYFLFALYIARRCAAVRWQARRRRRRRVRKPLGAGRRRRRILVDGQSAVPH
jgi:hypothetical protein